MEFGKLSLEELNRTEFRPILMDPRSLSMLKAHRGQRSPHLRFGVGCPVWNVKAWLGTVYPSETPSRDFLRHYSLQFNSIELNTTHYRIPDAQTIARWKSETPEGFRFCPKFPQEISHRYPLGGRKDLINDFVRSVTSLEERLGLSFLQLPPNFGTEDLPQLRSFLALLPSDFQIAIEVRHPDFFTHHRLADSFYDLLAKHRCHSVITDVAGRQDVLHLSLPTPHVLVRFIANDLHPSDELRMNAWIDRLSQWVDSGIEEVEFFVHQPEDRNAPETIALFIDAINSRLSLSLKKWQKQNHGEQLGFF